MAGYLREGIATAAADGAAAVVIELDTPGGSLDATRDIVQAELDARLPVHRVGRARRAAGPPARARSSRSPAHVAAMAPATNIGAATPDLRGRARTSPRTSATRS